MRVLKLAKLVIANTIISNIIITNQVQFKTKQDDIMKATDEDLFYAVEVLIVKLEQFERSVRDPERHERAIYALKALKALADAVMNRDMIFGIEPWHPLSRDVPLAHPAEMLLRLKDEEGEPIPPYPFVMACYEYGMTEYLDMVLFLCALNQMGETNESQISINVSGRSLLDEEFVRSVLGRVSDLEGGSDQQVIIEVHESAPMLTMDQEVLQNFRDHGVSFAMDDVGVSMEDAFRMDEFKSTASYVKIDRSCVCAEPEELNSLANVVPLIKEKIPGVIMVAEGVEDVEHALAIHKQFPDIAYAQGMYLPSREEFAAAYFGDKNTAVF